MPELARPLGGGVCPSSIFESRDASTVLARAVDERGGRRRGPLTRQRPAKVPRSRSDRTIRRKVPRGGVGPGNRGRRAVACARQPHVGSDFRWLGQRPEWGHGTGRYGSSHRLYSGETTGDFLLRIECGGSARRPHAELVFSTNSARRAAGSQGRHGRSTTASEFGATYSALLGGDHAFGTTGGEASEGLSTRQNVCAKSRQRTVRRAIVEVWGKTVKKRGPDRSPRTC